MTEIKLTKRYPQSRTEDIVDAYMRGWNDALDAVQNGKFIINDDRKAEPSNSEKPNNCEWSVEYAKEMLDTMPCEECGHWEHGAGDHYYCALLEMRQKCYFESKGESTLMFANKPKDEPTISKMEQVETMSCQECKRWIYDDRWGWFCPLKSQDECKYEPKDLEQFRVGLEYHTDTTHFGKVKGESITTNKVEDEPQTERSK